MNGAKRVELDDDALVTVCDACLCASCWQAAFFCERARGAGTTKKRVAELRELDRESPDYWREEAMAWAISRRARGVGSRVKRGGLVMAVSIPKLVSSFRNLLQLRDRDVRALPVPYAENEEQLDRYYLDQFERKRIETKLAFRSMKIEAPKVTDLASFRALVDALEEEWLMNWAEATPEAAPRSTMGEIAADIKAGTFPRRSSLDSAASGEDQTAATPATPSGSTGPAEAPDGH